MTKLSKASAPAKIILFGEHFVVYGNPAILASINRRITVIARFINSDKIIIRSDIKAAGEYCDSTFNPLEGNMKAKSTLDPLYNAIKNVLAARNQKVGIETDIFSEVPHGIGLGSSAASCVATIAAVDSLFGKPDIRKICEQAIESERMIHKNSSGADCYISTFGGLVNYNKIGGFHRIKAKNTLPLVIGDTGIKHSTGDLVARVKKFKDRNGTLFEALSRQARDICSQATVAISSNNREIIGRLMNENQEILKKIGVSHEKIDDLIRICTMAGALGVKMTGAGGGGAIIALAGSMKDSSKIASQIKAHGYDSFEARIEYKGLNV